MVEPKYSRDVLLLILFTGTRRSELTKLRRENSNLSAKTLYLPNTKVCEFLSL